MKLKMSFRVTYSTKFDPDEQSNAILRSTHDLTNKPMPLQDPHTISAEHTTMLLGSTHTTLVEKARTTDLTRFNKLPSPRCRKERSYSTNRVTRITKRSENPTKETTR